MHEDSMAETPDGDAPEASRFGHPDVDAPTTALSVVLVLAVLFWTAVIVWFFVGALT